MSSDRGAVVRYATLDVDLPPAPIDPTWVLAGEPQARARALEFAADPTIDASVWACSAGRFDWHYDRDEVIHILSGEAEVTPRSGSATTIGPGDIIYFTGGQVVAWHIPEQVMKIAFRSRKHSRLRAACKRIPLAKQVVHRLRDRRARRAIRDSRT